MPDPKSRMEGQRRLKRGRKEAYDTDDLRSYSEVERSKVKVTRPINAENTVFEENLQELLV